MFGMKYNLLGNLFLFFSSGGIELQKVPFMNKSNGGGSLGTLLMTGLVVLRVGYNFHLVGTRGTFLTFRPKERCIGI